MFRGEKGITLVALVITIIVLIILAAVSISAVMNTGLITNAENATEKFNTASFKESDWINNVTNQANTLMYAE